MLPLAHHESGRRNFGTPENQIRETGKLVRINVGHTKRYVAENATRPAEEDANAIVLAFLHDPLPAEKRWPADSSHAVIDGIPVENTPDAELIQDLLVDCILDQFDVEPD
jgi:hypothetical protein